MSDEHDPDMDYSTEEYCSGCGLSFDGSLSVVCPECGRQCA